MTDLNLSGNNIQLLPENALSSMEYLQVLSLHSNQLRAIPDLRRLNTLKVNYRVFFYLRNDKHLWMQIKLVFCYLSIEMFEHQKRNLSVCD